MNAVDGSSHVPQAGFANEFEEELPSLLVLVLDINPQGWLSSSTNVKLKDVLAALLVFLNSHLALSHSNDVAVIAAHPATVRFLYPPPAKSATAAKDSAPSNGVLGVEDEGDRLNADPTMYRQFRVVDETVLSQLDELLNDQTRTGHPDIDSTPKVSPISGALSSALAYVNRMIYTGNPSGSEEMTSSMRARILVVSISSDLAAQYVPIMNCIFAAQKMKVPIDVCKLGSDTVFLQQAADTSGGLYIHIEHPQGLVQYLLSAFLPDRLLRRHLITPTQSSVDFRAACFCHKRVVDIGYVCNVCLSIFCSPPADGACRVCDTIFDATELQDLRKLPILIASGAGHKRKVKRAKKSSADSPVVAASIS
ncbi:TFIIH subunit Tfb4/p34 [Lipomyces oligophaga]|uniref:TFIIH subunit Tfb4/p34 n=1 Tax=Lipomyces oligophaga TaxID=45792 RepID=UPI0034CD8215